jgi:hypothetical protein
VELGIAAHKNSPLAIAAFKRAFGVQLTRMAVIYIANIPSRGESKSSSEKGEERPHFYMLEMPLGQTNKQRNNKQASK